MAEDAVVGLVEGADEIGAGVGQLEAFAAPAVMLAQLHHRSAMLLDGVQWHQMHGIEFARRLEQHAGGVFCAAGRRERRPGGIAQGEIEGLGVGRRILFPFADMAREGGFR